jgi:hypothetical protein
MRLMSVPFTEDQVAADLMLREPKTLPGSATVEEVRAQLADPKMQLVLLADGDTFVGAVTSLPPDAPAEARAADYADEAPETIAPTAPAREAFDRAVASPTRRLVVLEDDRLLGLVCLNSKRTGFCQTA